MQGEEKKKLREYLLRQEKLTGERLVKQQQEFERQPDIAKEFLRWMETGRFADEVVVEGYSAGQVAKMADFLSGLGVYNFLITLREKPEQAKQYIADGFEML